MEQLIQEEFIYTKFDIWKCLYTGINLTIIYKKWIPSAKHARNNTHCPTAHVSGETSASENALRASEKTIRATRRSADATSSSESARCTRVRLLAPNLNERALCKSEKQLCCMSEHDKRIDELVHSNESAHFRTRMSRMFFSLFKWWINSGFDNRRLAIFYR